MSDRIPLLVKRHSGWRVPHLKPIFGDYLEIFDDTRWHLAPKHAMVICRPDELDDEQILDWALDHGIILDNIWDGHESTVEHPFPLLELKIDCFFWVHEYCWHRYHNLDNIILEPTYEYIALMPVRSERPHRVTALEKFQPILDRMIWSRENRPLPNDHPECYDRHFLKEWYDQTAMSIVLESAVETLNPFPLLSEKTFKPIMFGHPFLVLGCQGSLAWLKDRGFATYDNIFDESYDLIENWRSRLHEIYLNACRLGTTAWDSETRNRLDHNRSVFFDEKKIRSMVEEKIIGPIRNWYETRN